MINNEAQREDRFSLDDGEILILWPARVKIQGFADIAAWMDLVKRKMIAPAKEDPSRRAAIAALAIDELAAAEHKQVPETGAKAANLSTKEEV